MKYIPYMKFVRINWSWRRSGSAGYPVYARHVLHNMLDIFVNVDV